MVTVHSSFPHAWDPHTARPGTPLFRRIAEFLRRGGQETTSTPKSWAPTHAGGGRPGKMAEEEAPAGEEAPPPADQGPSEAQRMEEMYLAAFVAVGAPPGEGW